MKRMISLMALSILFLSSPHDAWAEEKPFRIGMIGLDTHMLLPSPSLLIIPKKTTLVGLLPVILAGRPISIPQSAAWMDSQSNCAMSLA